jgi:hypothetical protein
MKGIEILAVFLILGGIILVVVGGRGRVSQFLGAIKK